MKGMYSLGKSLDELQDVRISAGCLNFLPRDFFGRFGCTKQDIEFDSASVESRLLRNQSQVLPVLLDVEFCDFLAIKLQKGSRLNSSYRNPNVAYVDISSKGVIETFN
jgi:hypothetical protein